jgi:alkanesulfonate monooxygenase SsuD/methylene tetrahydromethanopterin reductase-like flavin-dependent oxidoreductase (luciferase family)
MRIGITMPSRTCELARIPEYARLADEAGFHSTWSYELYRNPFAMLCTSALATERTLLATGLAAGFPRSPFVTANEAADVDELSGGRMVLGLGIGVPEFLEAFHSTNAAHPAARASEYIDVLRLSWQYLNTAQAEPYAGEYYRFVPPPINPWGVRNPGRERIPIYLAAMRPRLLALAGEKAEGWVGYLPTPKFVEQKVRPGIEVGARRVGRDPEEIDLATEVICSVSPDREVAMRRARIHVGFYVAHPVSYVVVEVHGMQDQVNALRMGLMTEGFGALEKTPDELVETFSITGTPEEARQKLDQYSDYPHLILHTPYVPPLTAEESDDAYRQIIDAFGSVALASTSGASAVTAR